MNAEIKQKWIEALRSGEYKQGRQTLKQGNRYCCLGVLCSVAKAKNWTAYGSLPLRLNRSLGIDCNTEMVLVQMNDSGKKSFAEIADYIEEQL